MPAPATTDAFLDIVRKSNQVDETRLDTYLAERPTVGNDPRKTAASLVRAGVLTLFQAEQFLLGKHKGFSFAGYRIVERLGVGGTGTVYLGEHEAMKRKVAIKILPAPLASDPGVRERFRREARAAGVLDHPNVIHVLDYREESGLLAIIMEYVHGANLQQLINRRGPLPIGPACEYARQSALGLQHAHDHGMVHRDVKPANILVDGTGVVKVLDLGLARYQSDGDQSLTQKFNNKMVMGTADFLPPEQALSLHDVDARADVYALGATLYALLTGKPPFDDGSIGQKLLWHQTRIPERIDAVRPEVPMELADLVARMLAKSPDDRPGSCAEVADELTRWAGPADNRLDVRLSPRTLAEFTMSSPSSSLSCTNGRSLTGPSVETLNTLAQDETGRIETPTPLPAAPKGPLLVPRPPSPMRQFLLAGAFALFAGLIGGLVGMLLMRFAS